jgi:hypothetical protein
MVPAHWSPRVRRPVGMQLMTAVVVPGDDSAHILDGLAVENGAMRRAIVVEVSDDEGTVLDDLRRPSAGEGFCEGQRLAAAYRNYLQSVLTTFLLANWPSS